MPVRLISQHMAVLRLAGKCYFTLLHLRDKDCLMCAGQASMILFLHLRANTDIDPS